MSDRMTAMMEQEGNPMGAEMKSFGNAVAYYSRNMPWTLFNHVKGSLTPEEVDAAIDFYEQRGRRFEFQLAPGITDGQTLRRLAERGYYQSGFHVSMYAELDAMRDASIRNESLSAARMEAGEMSTYAEIHCLGTGLPLSGAGHVGENNRILHVRPGWHYLLGRYEGMPASAGVMFARGDVASCTFAATLPDMRNRGLHTALLQARITLAKELACKMIVAQCAYGSASHRNMETVGMRIGMTRATWSKL
ncbi:MAG: family N-acetyltransferase [Paenibacillus sp.]|jgi:GNAT superfamily N-acetyltransferase|nr:family N-acetyltransferase [Paenibacillus sp.]